MIAKNTLRTSILFICVSMFNAYRVHQGPLPDMSREVHLSLLYNFNFSSH